MRFFAAYLKQRKGELLVFFLFSIIFLCVFFLYHLPLGAVAYPAFLCMLLGAIFLFFDFRRVWRKHQSLVKLQKLSAEVMEEFPAVQSIEEQDYQDIIFLLKEEQKRFENEMNARYSDMEDYYTTWVHQIKTPIASMRLSLQNEDSVLSGKVMDDLLRIEQYVEMVLMFLRLGSGSTDYVIKEYDLDSIVKQAVKKFAGQFIRRKISLEYRPLGVSVLTDEKWLLFVLEQIISNALKYTPSGKIMITLEEKKTLVIRDTGIGIAPEDLPRIFEKGYTGYNGRVDKKASGLGLYLCQRICKNLGHKITAESMPGQGTAISLCLEKKKRELE